MLLQFIQNTSYFNQDPAFLTHVFKEKLSIKVYCRKGSKKWNQYILKDLVFFPKQIFNLLVTMHQTNGIVSAHMILWPGLRS